MNIETYLVTDYCKQGILEIADYIGSDRTRFSVLMDIVLRNDKPMAQRAAWAVSHCLESHPSLADPYLSDMVNLLDKDVHDAIHRFVLRSFETVKLPVEFHGLIIDKAFAILMNRKASIAPRMFAMTVIYRLSKVYPEIKPELDLVLNEELEYGSTGFRNRAKKMLAGKYRLRKGEDG